jgi:uncharacterized membrane protein
MIKKFREDNYLKRMCKMNIGELKRNAKKSLKGRWLKLVIPILITIFTFIIINIGISYLFYKESRINHFYT